MGDVLSWVLNIIIFLLEKVACLFISCIYIIVPGETFYICGEQVKKVPNHS